MSSKKSAENALRSHVTSVKEDLMTGVSYMIPFVTIGGIFLALGYAVAGITGTGVQQVFEATGTLGWFLTQIGSAGLTLMVPALGAYIAYAIADRPGLAPGFVLSWILQQGNVLVAAGDVIGLQGGEAGAGYLGALVAGLLTGYVALWLKRRDVPGFIQPMMPVLIVPVLTVAILAPLLLFVIGVPVATANAALTAYLEGLQGGGQAVLIGAIIGAMMAFDMGGPVNKVAYLFAVGLISEGIYQPMAAVMIAGMIPPIGLAISNFIAPQKYAAEMYENAKSGIVLGASFITEGAIPYASADPLRVIPSIIAGSAVGGAMAMALNVTMPAPHGGIFVVLLSNKPLMFLAAIVIGSLVTAVIATVIKPDYEDRVAQEHDTGTETTTSD
jgi:PTS system fructose-specific IIC component